jgi:hypothetical protein
MVHNSLMTAAGPGHDFSHDLDSPPRNPKLILGNDRHWRRRVKPVAETGLYLVKSDLTAPIEEPANGQRRSHKPVVEVGTA